MTEILVNPGSEPAEGAISENADANMVIFAADVQTQHGYQSVDVVPLDGSAGGRYRYGLTCVGANSRHSFDVAMPGLPLGQTRYVDVTTQNPFDFTRLYVDGSSWLWKFAVNACRPPEDET